MSTAYVKVKHPVTDEAIDLEYDLQSDGGEYDDPVDAAFIEATDSKGNVIPEKEAYKLFDIDGACADEASGQYDYADVMAQRADDAMDRMKDGD